MGSMGRPAKRPKSRFSERLIALRKACGLSQSQLSEAMGVSHSIICYWECKADNPRYHTLEQLAAFFHVTPGYFLDEIPDKPGRKPNVEALCKRIRKLPPEKLKLVSDFVRMLSE